jgi:signal transduction histidine kinase
MSRRPVSARVALAGSLLTLLLLAGASATAGYVVEAHTQQSDRDHRLAVAAAYFERAGANADTKRWGRALGRKLDALGLGATHTLVGPPEGKRLLYNEPYRSSDKPPAAAEPTATHVFPLAPGSGRSLRLSLFAPPLDHARRLLVALASGLAALIAGMAIVTWAARRWLVVPLRRLSTQVDAIAGGERIGMPVTSPIREAGNVAGAIAGMAARIARTAEHDARLDAERRLLISSIAHDLRTPLFSLRDYLDAIAAGIGDPRERLDQARLKAGQLDRLVTSLFDYARAELDQRPRRQGTELAAAIADTASALELVAHEHGVELRVTARASPLVAIDRAALERALTNVLDNALRYTPPGGAVDVTCGEDADGAFVQIVDDGPGIALDLLPRLFEPIARGEPTRNGRTDGAGLGLTIAARLLRNQGGTIDAANAPGRGASLTLRIPRAPRVDER